MSNGLPHMQFVFFQHTYVHFLTLFNFPIYCYYKVVCNQERVGYDGVKTVLHQGFLCVRHIQVTRKGKLHKPIYFLVCIPIQY